MGTSDSTSPWASLPASLRRASIIALATAMVAGTLLYREGLASDPSDPPAGPNAPGNLARPGLGGAEPSPTPEPTPTRPSRSRAVLTAPDGSDPDPAEVTVPSFPTFGTYIYSLQGSEQVALSGSRNYPSEARMKVHRPSSVPPGGRTLRADEVLLELDLGSQHSEHEVLAFTEEGLLLTFAGRSITFGNSGSTDQSTFDPPIPQIPVPLNTGGFQRGTSQVRTATGGSGGTEEWTVRVTGQEDLRIMGRTVATWMVSVERRNRSGDENTTRTRTYWLDPARSLWVKWTDETTIQRGFSLGGFNYESSYTATLTRVEPV